MIFIDTFLYYTLFASAVLIYGIGLNSVAEIGIHRMNQVTYFTKAVLSIFVSSILSWIVVTTILVPLKIIEIYPLICFLIFICINVFIEGLIRLTTGVSTAEFLVSYLIVLLSISESTSIIYTMIICGSCFVALLILVPFAFTFKNRIQTDGYSIDEKYYSLFFIFLGLLILMMSSWDILWITPGVIK